MEKHLTINKKRIFFLTTMAFVFMLSVNINVPNSATLSELLNDELIQSPENLKKSELPEDYLTGTGLNLPLEGSANASKENQNINSWTGGYQTANIPFATPESFWSGATISYEKVRVNIYDIIKTEDKQATDFEDWTSWTAYGTGSTYITTSHNTGNSPWTSDETIKFDYSARNAGPTGVSLTYQSSWTAHTTNARVITYETDTAEGGVGCGWKTYDTYNSYSNSGAGETGSSGTGKVDNELDRDCGFLSIGWSTDCKETNVNNNHADISYDEDYSDSNVGVWGDLDYYLNADDHGDQNGIVSHGNNYADRNDQDHTFYWSFYVTNDIYHAYDIDFSANYYMNAAIDSGAGYRDSADIWIDLQYYDGSSWQDATGANYVFSRDESSGYSSSWGAATDSSVVYNAIKSHGVNAGRPYRFYSRVKFELDSNYVYNGDNSWRDNDAALHVEVGSMALSYSEENQYTTNHMSESVRGHYGGVGSYFYGVINNGNTEKGDPSFKITTVNDANNRYDGFISNTDNRFQLTQGQSYVYQMDVWIPADESVRFAMRQWSGGGYQAETYQNIDGTGSWETIEMEFVADSNVSSQIEGVQTSGTYDDVFSFWIKDLHVCALVKEGYTSNNVAFGYEIDGDVTFRFEAYASDGLVGADGYTDTTPAIDTLKYGSVHVQIYADGTLWQEGSYTLKALQDDADNRIAFEQTYSKSGIESAANLQVRAYTRVTSGFCVANDISDGYALIRNVEIECTTKRDLGADLDINVQLTESGNPQGLPTQVTTANQEINNNEADFDISDSEGFIFTTTTPNLEFNYDYTTFLTFTDTLNTEYHAYANSFTIFSTDFSFDITGIDYGYTEDYYDTFQFKIGIPEWAYWDLTGHLISYPGREHLAFVDDTSVGGDDPNGFYATDVEDQQNNYVYIDKTSQLSTYSNTHPILFSNTLIKAPTFDDQTWQMNFTIDSVMDELYISNETSQAQIIANPDTDFFAGDDTVNLYAGFTEVLNEGGEVGVCYYNPSDNLVNWSYADTKTLSSSDEMTFIGYDEAWKIGKLVDNNVGYSAWVNYTADNLNGAMNGKYRVCLKTETFEVLHRTSYKIYIWNKLYDTRVQGVEGELLNITVEWIDDNTEQRIQGATTKTFWLTNYRLGGGPAHDPPEPNDPAKVTDIVDYTLNETDSGNYTISYYPVFRDFEDHIPAGDIGKDFHLLKRTVGEEAFPNWGYHNFSITLQKDGYRPLTIHDDFDVVVDTIMRVESPQHSYTDSSGNPHYAVQIMGEPFTIKVRNYYNFTTGTGENEQLVSMSGSEGSFYEGQIEINYTLWAVYENWTTTQDMINRDNWGSELFNYYRIGKSIENGTLSTNPLNGTFYVEPGAETYKAEIQWPTAQHNPNRDRYDSGRVMVYKISSRTFNNKNYEYLGDETDGWKFQPNKVRNHTTIESVDPPYSDATEPLQEEPIKIKLLSPEFGNATDLQLLNLPRDGHPFNKSGSVYQNETVDEPIALEETYTIEQFWHNITENNNPDYLTYDTDHTGFTHDGTVNAFRLRVILNCTHSGIGTEFISYEAPPVGLLNYTDYLYGDQIDWMGATTDIYLEDWNSSIIQLKPDGHVVQFTPNSTNGNPRPEPAYGQSYVSPWLFFNSSDAGTHSCTITAHKEGFIDSDLPVNIKILEQKTQLNDSDTRQVYTPKTLRPPIGNSTEFKINYLDITNEKMSGELPVIDGQVSIISDSFQNYYNGKMGDTWSFVDRGNGNYSIYFNKTLKYPTGSPTDPDYGLIEMQIAKDNHETRLFNVYLIPKKRNLSINYVYGRDKNIYAEEDQISLDNDLIYLSFELRDMDNKTTPEGKLINFETDFYTKSQTFDQSIYDLDINSTENGINRALENSEYDGPNKWIWDNIRYNFTISTHFDVGTYTINFSMSGLDNYLDTNVEHDIEIVKPNMTLKIIEKDNETEYYPRVDNTNVNLMPWYRVELIDLNFTQILGYEYNLTYEACVLTGNWSQNNYHFDKVTYSEHNVAQISIDTRGNASERVYHTSIKIDKGGNYNPVNQTFSFEIFNATTTFDKTASKHYVNLESFYNEEDTAEFTASTSNRYLGNGENDTVVPWGKWVMMKFTYKTILNFEDGAPFGISSNKIDGDVNVSIDPYGWPVNWTNFAPSISDRGDGEFIIKFNLNIPNEGASSGGFKLHVLAKNFNPMNFDFNLSTRDRITTKSLDIAQNVGKWNETTDLLTAEITWSYLLTFGVRYSDADAGVYMTDAVVTCPYATTDENMTWSYTEKENGIYSITIDTENLTVNKAYNLQFIVNKAHYNAQSFYINFTVIPVEYEVVVEIEPGEDFNPNDVEEITVRVSIYVNITDTTGAEVRKQVNVDYTIEGLEVLWEIRKDGIVVKSGKFEWNEVDQKFVAVIPTSVGADDTLKGVYQLIIKVQSDNPNFASYSSDSRDEVIKIAALGEVEKVPPWFWPMLIGVIGAIAGLAGYTVRKAIYLSIPFVLRKIDETIKKIEKDKFPPVGVMTGRDEFIINSVVDYLEECGIEWERDDKFEAKKIGEAGGAKEKLPPLSPEQLEAELAKIPDIESDEKMLFMDELKRLDREAQDEFLASLRGEIKK